MRFPGCTLAESAIEVDGATWLICNGRPARLVGDRVETLGKELNLPQGAATSLTVDGEGTVWMIIAGQMLSMRKGEQRFRSSGAQGIDTAVPAPDGRLWSAGKAGLIAARAVNGMIAESTTVLRGSFGKVHFDKDGGLWAVDADGLVHAGDIRRLPRPSSGAPFGSDAMTRATGLGSDAITALFEDDRGSIWIGTAAGLERFKDNYFFPVKLPGRALAASIAPGDDGTVWAANYTGKLMQISNSSIRTFDAIDNGVTSLARAPDGTVWVAAEQGRLFQVHGDKIAQAVTVPAEIHGSAITSMTWDVSGALWIGTTINGVIARYTQGQWTAPHGFGGLPEHWTSRTILADRRGRLWASRRYEMTLFENSVATRFSEAQGLKVGEVLALSEAEPRLWVGGTQGVAYFDGTAFQTLKPATEDAFSEITGILETRNGDLWIHEYSAAIKVSAAELEKQRRNADYRVRTERFDALDGLYGTSLAFSARPSLIEATDGRIWFSTTDGLAAVDPARTRPGAYVPKIRIQSVAVDGVARELQAPLTLTRQTKVLRFLYTAVNPQGTERLQFRYRLDGLDTDWTVAGSRRAISYNSLAPGAYRFRVESSDGAGGWAANDTFFSFRVEPMWYETMPFRFACGVLALLAAWAIYDRVAKRASRRVRLQMRVQQVERERIARDLHDTLLQGVHGLIWRLQGIADEIPRSDPVRGKLEGALDNTDGLLEESRRRVMVLRLEKSEPLSLTIAVENAILSTVALHPCTYAIEVVGDERHLDDTVQVNVCDVVREAFTNAVKHGRASSIRIQIDYSRQALIVRIVDNGSGFSPEVARRGRSGHWGIAGMKERAIELGGSLLIKTAVGEGTEVMFRLRGNKAYEVGLPRTGLFRRLASFLQRSATGGVRTSR